MSNADKPAMSAGPVQMPGSNFRRVIRVLRLFEELGHHGDTLAALEELKQLRSERATLDAAVAAARAEERERCAKLCEGEFAHAFARHAAAAIRNPKPN